MLTDRAALAAIERYSRAENRHRRRAEIERAAGRPKQAEIYDLRAAWCHRSVVLEETNPQPRER